MFCQCNIDVTISDTKYLEQSKVSWISQWWPCIQRMQESCVCSVPVLLFVNSLLLIRVRPQTQTLGWVFIPSWRACHVQKPSTFVQSIKPNGRIKDSVADVSHPEFGSSIAFPMIVIRIEASSWATAQLDTPCRPKFGRFTLCPK